MCHCAYGVVPTHRVPTARGQLGFFEHWDKSGDATLDKSEFVKMAQRLGWGDAVSSIIRSVDYDGRYVNLGVNSEPSHSLASC